MFHFFITATDIIIILMCSVLSSQVDEDSLRVHLLTEKFSERLWRCVANILKNNDLHHQTAKHQKQRSTCTFLKKSCSSFFSCCIPSSFASLIVSSWCPIMLCGTHSFLMAFHHLLRHSQFPRGIPSCFESLIVSSWHSIMLFVTLSVYVKTRNIDSCQTITGKFYI